MSDPKPIKLKIQVPTSEEEREKVNERILEEIGITDESKLKEPEKPDIMDDYGKRMPDPSRFGGGRG
jgi:hypothetical protein